MKLIYLFTFLVCLSNITQAATPEPGVCCDVEMLEKDCENQGGADSVYCNCYCAVHSDDEDCMVSSTTEVSSTSGDGETTTPGCDVGQVADDSGTNCRMSIDLRSAFGKTWNIRMG